MSLRKIENDKRRDLRLKMSRPIVVKLEIKKPKGLFNIRRKKKSGVEDISVGGVRIELPVIERKEIDKIIEGKEKLVLELNLPSFRKPVKVVGKPVWLKKKDKGHKVVYVLGLSFEGISPHDREKILGQLINSCLTSSCTII